MRAGIRGNTKKSRWGVFTCIYGDNGFHIRTCHPGGRILEITPFGQSGAPARSEVVMWWSSPVNGCPCFSSLRAATWNAQASSMPPPRSPPMTFRRIPGISPFQIISPVEHVHELQPEEPTENSRHLQQACSHPQQSSAGPSRSDIAHKPSLRL